MVNQISIISVLDSDLVWVFCQIFLCVIMLILFVPVCLFRVLFVFSPSGHIGAMFDGANI
jgi:hypothetical protein